MVEIFEGYANAGLSLLKSWSTQYRSQRGFQSIIQGLFDNSFISEDTVDRETYKRCELLMFKTHELKKPTSQERTIS